MRPFGFSIASRERKATFQCAHCPATIDINLAGQRNLNPEFAAKKAAQRGWIAYPFNETRNCCPKCQGPKKNDPDSELRKVIPMALPTPIKPPVEVREPTPDQRMRIRGHLDKNFDDSAGAYLDEMSDLRIAEIVGVPRIIVERMREAAYGPIRVNPEAARLREDIAKFKEAIEGQQRGLDSLKTQMSSLASRLELLLAGKAP